MNDAIRKADVLIEALSYIRTFRDKLTVIKLGGSAMEDADALREAIHTLDEEAKPFIELVMNRAMTRALAGHSVEQA